MRCMAVVMEEVGVSQKRRRILELSFAPARTVDRGPVHPGLLDAGGMVRGMPEQSTRKNINQQSTELGVLSMEVAGVPLSHPRALDGTNKTTQLLVTPGRWDFETIHAVLQQVWNIWLHSGVFKRPTVGST